MQETENEFKWNWGHFFIYGLVWWFVSSIYHDFIVRSVELDRSDLECIYDSLREDPDLTDAQEKTLVGLCGEDPCDEFSGCALDETKEKPCAEFDKCHDSDAYTKYFDCYYDALDTVIPLSKVVKMSTKELRQRLDACYDEN